MVDTVRSISALQTLFADNTSGDISAQDLRDFLVTMQAMAVGFEPGADDIVWNAAANVVGDGTQLAISGTETITEGFGTLDVKFSGQTANDLGGLLYAHSFTIGDRFAVPCAMYPEDNGDFTWTGVMFTDGVADTSNVVTALTYEAGGSTRWIGSWSGTLTNFSTLEVENSGLMTIDHQATNGDWTVELEYSAANTFQCRFGPGYGSTITMGLGTSGVTMTPTHVGVFWTKDGSAGEASVRFGSIRKTA